MTDLSRKLISFVIDLLCTDILVAVCHSNVLVLLRLVLQPSWRLQFFLVSTELLACENIRFSSLFAAGNVSRGGRAELSISDVC